MDKIKESSRPLVVNMKFEALKSFKGEVKKFGTGGAHIVFSTDYLGYEVAVVPIKKISGGKE
jgi:putative transposon-encoded protein